MAGKPRRSVGCWLSGRTGNRRVPTLHTRREAFAADVGRRCRVQRSPSLHRGQPHCGRSHLREDQVPSPSWVTVSSSSGLVPREDGCRLEGPALKGVTRRTRDPDCLRPATLTPMISIRRGARPALRSRRRSRLRQRAGMSRLRATDRQPWAPRPYVTLAARPARRR
jgi:hypothetical protein